MAMYYCKNCGKWPGYVYANYSGSGKHCPICNSKKVIAARYAGTGMKTGQALQKLNNIPKLLAETKSLIKETKELLKGNKTKLRNIKPLCRQGELFIDTPVYDEKLSRLCLNALVETT